MAWRLNRNAWVLSYSVEEVYTPVGSTALGLSAGKSYLTGQEYKLRNITVGHRGRGLSTKDRIYVLWRDIDTGDYCYITLQPSQDYDFGIYCAWDLRLPDGYPTFRGVVEVRFGREDEDWSALKGMVATVWGDLVLE